MASTLKWQRVLGALLAGRRLTRFTAEALGDHCLPSTISYLRRRGLDVSRRPVVLNGRFGRIHCQQYQLEDDQKPAARRLLKSA